MIAHRLLFLTVLFLTSALAEDGKAIDPTAKNITVLNKGIGGNNTRQGLRRWQRDVFDQHPNLVVLYLGMNDAVNSKNSVPVDEYGRNLEAMIVQAKEKGIGIVLITITPVIESYVLMRHDKAFFAAESPNQKIARYNAVLKDLARKHAVHLIQLDELFRTRGEPKEDSSSLLRNTANSKTTDGVHYTAAGYALLAEAVSEALAGKIKPGQRIVCFGDSLTFGAGAKGAGTTEGDTYPAKLATFLNFTFKPLPSSR